ncbi:hypothetical protein [Flavisphingomonas formosensis]|uniref:hypothetical protein n=1 Tax=Flavisphingomonas formosensis TaxID=861534 RepID=UPI0012F7EF63|nr:hypothetical protein [Sphingomonas formosensis]
MRQLLIAAIVSLGLVSGLAAPVAAAPCKDAKGKFIKCPPPKPAPPATKTPCKDAKGKFTKCPQPPAAAKAPPRCKDAKGKFTKCGTPGSKAA